MHACMFATDMLCGCFTAANANLHSRMNLIRRQECTVWKQPVGISDITSSIHAMALCSTTWRFDVSKSHPLVNENAIQWSDTLAASGISRYCFTPQ